MPGFSTGVHTAGRPASPTGGGGSFNARVNVSAPGAAQTAKQIQGVGKQTSILNNKLLRMTIAAAGAYASFNMLKKVIIDSVGKFREFETRMAEVSTILGELDMNILPALSAGVETLSMKFGQSTSDMAKGLYDILSAAFDAQESINLLNTATKASIAGLSTVRDSVDIFTTILNSYGMAVEEAAQVSDYLFQSVIRGKFQFEELSSALQYVVPIAAQAGISIKELMAALSTATRHGLRLDMTSRGLALAIQNIINPTEGARKAAEQYGIDMSALGLRAEGLYNWFRKLYDKTEQYGKNIIPEMIKNMRSLRVALVLAGEEGILGFADDLRYLENSWGRTDEAMAKIMDTQQFRANQLREEISNVQREWGDMWGDVAIGIQKAMVWIMRPDASSTWLAEVAEKKYPFTDDVISNTKTYLKLIEDLKDEGKLVEDTWIAITKELPSEAKRIPVPILPSTADIMEYSTERLTELTESWNAFTGEIKTSQQVIGDTEILITELENSISILKRELKEPYEWGMNKQYETGGSLYYQMELLKAQRDYADITHDVTMGLEDENYEWKIHDENLQNAVTDVREYKKMQEENRESMERYTLAMRDNNIEIMKIQLSGMQRRRGLTRGEERRIKKLRTLNLEQRIDQQENMKGMSIEEYDRYLKNKKFIDDSLRNSEEYIYQMKYNWNEQIKDLQTHIDFEEGLLITRNEQFETAFTNLETNLENHIKNLKSIMKDPVLVSLLGGYGIDIESMITSAEKRYKKVPDVYKRPPTVADRRRQKMYEGWGFQRGTHYVPETGPAIVHRGEQIVPAGQRTQRQSNPIIINVNIDRPTISKRSDIDRLAKQTALLTATKFGDKIKLMG